MLCALSRKFPHYLENSENSLENFPFISCIRLKFSREFIVSIANTRKSMANTHKNTAINWA